MRYAILAGSNYIGSRNELNGCLNDLDDIRSIIEPTGISIVADLRGDKMSTDSWKNALMEVSQRAISGDVVYHMHSNHGTRLKIGNEMCEAYCPNDFDGTIERMITDKWMASLMDGLADGVKWVEHADCCHAGDSIRSLYVKEERPRYINLPWLSSSDTLTLSPMVVCQNTNGILLAACRSDQVSNDAKIGGRYCGAFTNAFIRSLKQIPYGTYQQLMINATQILGLGGFDQKPEFDGRLGTESGIFANDVLGFNYSVMDYKTTIK